MAMPPALGLQPVRPQDQSGMEETGDGEYDGASQHARLLALGAALGSALQGGTPCAVVPGIPALGGTAPSAGDASPNDSHAPEVARMSSKYVGVHRSGKKRKPWTAACYWMGKQHHLGYFKTEEEAAKVYDDFVRDRGLERRVNFPVDSDEKMSAADAKASSKSTRGIASRFAGVHHSRSNPARPWRASCMSKRKYHHLGIYATEEEAALAYDAFIIEHNLGRELNFPQYRHMLQLGAAGAQSLGAIAQHIPGFAGAAQHGHAMAGAQALPPSAVEGLPKGTASPWMPAGHVPVQTSHNHPSFSALLAHPPHQQRPGMGLPHAGHMQAQPVGGNPPYVHMPQMVQPQQGGNGTALAYPHAGQMPSHWAHGQPQMAYASASGQPSHMNPQSIGAPGTHQGAPQVAHPQQPGGRFVWMNDASSACSHREHVQAPAPAATCKLISDVPCPYVYVSCDAASHTAHDTRALNMLSMQFELSSFVSSIKTCAPFSCTTPSVIDYDANDDACDAFRRCDRVGLSRSRAAVRSTKERFERTSSCIVDRGFVAHGHGRWRMGGPAMAGCAVRAIAIRAANRKVPEV
eukprot:CAMPEP_0185189530 /NCGR_PEP_ID=MMETSP1140-20130426/6090_1 /TAXON_ID=298111 /ORGANISM="Pavlova sp., Strain CCMP459" /LENGTH=576 /DNA_ID=CAMNT_0027756097 /DNA_START=75 /DNA_END=1804 /DNA_ORIENTATION=-